MAAIKKCDKYTPHRFCMIAGGEHTYFCDFANDEADKFYYKFAAI